MEKLNKIVNLVDTVDMMSSPDFKERFKAEYYQLKIRADSLNNMLIKMLTNNLDFKPKCSFDLLNAQLRAMDLYMNYLEDRAEIEGIEL